MTGATPTLADNPPAIIGLRNYRHLAAHHGHDLAVSIYGGDASVALECETCSTILIAFENTPTQEAVHAALLAVTRRLHIEPRHIASHLTDVAARQADTVNSEGLHAQLAYLLHSVGLQPAHELIERIAAETRRG